MKKFKCRFIIIETIITILLFSITGTALGWYDKTHISIARAAGYKMWYNAAGPDIAKIKAGNIEAFNHWFNNNRELDVTSQMVMQQTIRYNKADFSDAEGHLYGAIIASLREYEAYLKSGLFAEHNMAYCAHYIGDLSMPLHNVPYDEFNKYHHNINDATVDKVVLDHPENITRYMYDITLRNDCFEEDLSKEIARIANISRLLGQKIRAENRDMTPQEAYIQLGHSSSLFRAVLKHYKKL
ncbi:MAG: hypothetical protein ABFD50_23170 [Smithella sp.]